MVTPGGAGGRGDRAKDEGAGRTIPVHGICRRAGRLFMESTEEACPSLIKLEGPGVRETSNVMTIGAV